MPRLRGFTVPQCHAKDNLICDGISPNSGLLSGTSGSHHKPLVARRAEEGVVNIAVIACLQHAITLFVHAAETIFVKRLVTCTDVLRLVDCLAAYMALRIPAGSLQCVPTKPLSFGFGPPELVISPSVDNNAVMCVLKQCDHLGVVLPLPQLILLAEQHTILFGHLNNSNEGIKDVRRLFKECTECDFNLPRGGHCAILLDLLNQPTNRFVGPPRSLNCTWIERLVLIVNGQPRVDLGNGHRPGLPHGKWHRCLWARVGGSNSVSARASRLAL
mmetsp:Transcript_13256/g.33866  ORF Transcript_13256/g.33866 Transcript_13256/m.33866 type:complete len:273 (-) Transcript_13256:574-1392(-)